MRITINYKTFVVTEEVLADLNELLHRPDVSVVDRTRDNKWKEISKGEANPVLKVNQTTEWEGQESD